MNAVVSQEGADLLWPERVGAGGHTSEQRVLHGILHAKLLQVCSCLGNLVTKGEPKCEARHGILQLLKYMLDFKPGVKLLRPVIKCPLWLSGELFKF